MMTKKTMTILSVFMIVALTAVGFAAWLIVGTIEGETQGSFVSNELEDKFFKVEVEFDKTGEGNSDNGTITFGAPDGNSSSSNWLSYKDDDAKEKLSATATIKFTPDAGFEKNSREMDYFLLQSENYQGEQLVSSTYRTIRVMLDINEVVTSDSETDNYKWFDWAVQLGYLQYPTAEWIDPATSAPQNKPLSWLKTVVTGEDENQEISYAPLGENETPSFENCFLYIDLTYDMFTIQYDADGDNNANTADYATAEVKISFNWGEAVSEITTPDDENTTDVDETVITYYNPYEFFSKKEPKKPVDVDYYLDYNGTYSLETVSTENRDDPDTEEVERYSEKDSKTIRYKDLAQRMLDYLYDHLNYVPADAEEHIDESGIQFSITLVEGYLQVVEAE